MFTHWFRSTAQDFHINYRRASNILTKVLVQVFSKVLIQVLSGRMCSLLIVVDITVLILNTLVLQLSTRLNPASDWTQ